VTTTATVQAGSAALPAVFTTDVAAPQRTLVDILAVTAALHPNATALDAGGVALSYRRLAADVEVVRRRLATAGIGRGDRVGVRIASGTVELYVAILAVLAAGAAYVPVDADDPDERAEPVFGEAAVCAVLGDGCAITMRHAPVGTPGRPRPEDDAWVIFTSGSTGTPKGVAVRHAGAAAFVDAEARMFLADEPIGPGDRVLGPVRGLRRLVRGDVAGLAARCMPGAGPLVAGGRRTVGMCSSPTGCTARRFPTCSAERAPFEASARMPTRARMVACTMTRLSSSRGSRGSSANGSSPLSTGTASRPS
jgi:non-ribosomal peptide synthetase component F